MADKKSEELAVMAGVSLEKPDWMEASKDGTEHITQADMQMPRLLLAQKMSPEVDSSESRYIEGLKIGDFFNGLTKEVYGKGPLHFVVLRADPPRGVEFIPREEGGGVRDPNVPLDDPRMSFGPAGEKPVATKFYDFIILLLPLNADPMSRMVALSFKSTGIKIAKQLNGLITLRNQAVYRGVYRLTSKEMQNNQGKWSIPEIANAGFISDQRVDAQLKDISLSLRTKKIEIQRTGDDHGDLAGGEGAGDTSFPHGANVGTM